MICRSSLFRSKSCEDLTHIFLRPLLELMSRKPIQTLTLQIVNNSVSPDPELRLSAATSFWGLASKLSVESLACQREVCLAVLPVILPLAAEEDAIKVPVLKGFRDLCRILPLHDILIEQELPAVLINIVSGRQTQRVLLNSIFCLTALAGNDNEVVAIQVATKIVPRLQGLLTADSKSIVACVLALIHVLALYRNLAPLLFGEPDLQNRVIELQEHEDGHVKTNAGLVKQRLYELKDIPVGPNRAGSGGTSEEPVPPLFAAAYPPSSTPPLLATTPLAPSFSNRLPSEPIPLGAKDRRSRGTHSNKNEMQRVIGPSIQGRPELDTLEYAASEPIKIKTNTTEEIPVGSPLLTQQNSIGMLPMLKTSSVPNFPALCSPTNLERKSSLPRIGDEVLARVPSRDRSDGVPRSRSNDSPRVALQRRDSRPTRSGSDQKKRELRKVSGEELPPFVEGERVANLDKAFETNTKWPDGIANMQFREPKASTLPIKKHGAFDGKKRKIDKHVQAWLDYHEFGEYSEQFAADKITYDTLLRLTIEDLEHLGVHALGDRKKMLWQIEKDARRKAKQSALHLAVLHSNPLNGPETPGFPNKLDIREEQSVLCDSFRECGRQIRVRFAPATCDNLLKMLTKGCRAIHISGHGDPRNLMLEDGKGGSKDLDVTTLKNIIELSGENLQFVFISACFSSTAANAFVEAGVPHVIAVQESVQISDVSARNFARHVYMALCQGLTVEKAFNKGQAGVLAGKCPKPCCCAHLHAPDCVLCPKCRTPVCCAKHVGEGCHVVTQCCTPQIPHDENLKFLLMPPTIEHNVKLFDGVGLGEWVNCTPNKIINNLPSVPDHFAGRSKDMLCIVQTLLKPTRLVTIAGPGGIGKSALARAAARYVHERRHFEGGCFLLQLGDCTQVEQIRQVLEEAMASAPKPKDAKNTLYKSVLYVFDNCDKLIDEREIQKTFQQYLQSFLERHAQATVLMTSRQSMGNIAFLTHRVLHLGPLHPLDSVALYLNRIPRDLGVQDFGNSDIGSNMTLQQLALYPLFPKLKGNPRLIELCAEILQYMTLCDLERCLSIPTSKWPNMTEPVQLLLLRIKSFGMVSYPPPQAEPERQPVNPELQQIQHLQRMLGFNQSPYPTASIPQLPSFAAYPSKLDSLLADNPFPSLASLPAVVGSSAGLMPPSIAAIPPSLLPPSASFPSLSTIPFPPSILPSLPATTPSLLTVPSSTSLPSEVSLVLPPMVPVLVSSPSTSNSNLFSTPSSTPSPLPLLPSITSPLPSPVLDEPKLIIVDPPSSPTPPAADPLKVAEDPIPPAVAVHLPVASDEDVRKSPLRGRARLPLPSSKPPPVPTGSAKERVHSSSPTTERGCSTSPVTKEREEYSASGPATEHVKQNTLACPAVATRVKNSPPPPTRPPPPTSASRPKGR